MAVTVGVVSPSLGEPTAQGILLNGQGNQLLDFSQKLDIGLLDNVVSLFYNRVGEEVTWLQYDIKLARVLFVLSSSVKQFY